jgi:hypothetical protein
MQDGEMLNKTVSEKCRKTMKEMLKKESWREMLLKN